LYIFASKLNIYTNTMKEKEKRQETIVKIISSQKVRSQEDIKESLKSMGINITQATLSRDLKELKVYKKPVENNEYEYAIPSAMNTIQNGKTTLIKNEVTLEFSGNIAVLKTRPGNAGSVAYDIDSNNPSEVIGTIAGDDTIIMVMREGVSHDELFQSFIKFIPELKRL